MSYHFRTPALIFSCLVSFFLPAAVSRQIMTLVVEEATNGTLFKHLTEVDNGIKKESFFVNGKTVSGHDYEEALATAQKEEHKKERQKHQEERIKSYETQYKGRVKIAQADLKQAISSLENELSSLADERIKPFMLYTSDTLNSPDHITSIKEKTLPEAVKLVHISPDASDIKKINDLAAEVRTLIPRVRETFIAAVNNGINKADDTKLLKELLNLL